MNFNLHIMHNYIDLGYHNGIITIICKLIRKYIKFTELVYHKQRLREVIFSRHV